MSQSVSGHDGNGKEYQSVDELWQQSVEPDGGESWYSKAMEYWSSQEASIDGVLGGFGNLHPVDLAASEQFLSVIDSQYLKLGTGYSADCGAGVGRITQFMLSKRFSKVDIIEPCSKLIEQAKIELPKTVGSDRIGDYVNLPLQSFHPSPGKYNLIWHQWVLLYLPDDTLVDYLIRCRHGLTPGGVICAKENVSLKGHFLVDPDDNSITRTVEQYKDLFSRAGLRILLQMRQSRWPPGLFPVLMFALVPI